MAWGCEARDIYCVARCGKRFSAVECLVITKESVAQSLKSPNQREENMLERIACICHSTLGMEQGAEELRCSWKRRSKNCQICLAARQCVIKNMCSRPTMEEAREIVMESYCSPAGTRDRSEKMGDAPDFSYIDGAILLM